MICMRRLTAFLLLLLCLPGLCLAEEDTLVGAWTVTRLESGENTYTA